MFDCSVVWTNDLGYVVFIVKEDKECATTYVYKDIVQLIKELKSFIDKGHHGWMTATQRPDLIKQYYTAFDDFDLAIGSTVFSTHTGKATLFAHAAPFIDKGDWLNFMLNMGPISVSIPQR